MIDWNAVSAIASLISAVVFVISALYVRAELKAIEKDRYLTITNQLFAIWENKEFMDAQLWLLHRLEQKTWAEFIKAHRGDPGEAAFHRVGSFYDHVGTLVRLRLVKQDEILATVGAYAIAVWQKIHPLVSEARAVEHSTLFVDFERLLPSCYECYVPSQGKDARVNPFSLVQPGAPAAAPPRVSVAELKRRLDKADPVVLLDVRRPGQVADDPRKLPQALWIPIDEVDRRRGELPAGREIIAYCA